MRTCSLKAVFAVFGVGFAAGSFALNINITFAPGTNATAQAAINRAADKWEAILKDPVQVNFNCSFSDLGAGIGGGALPVMGTSTYLNVKNAMMADAQAGDDQVAVANLQAGNAVSFYLNRTANSPHGNGSATVFVDNDGDANNTTLRFARANAKALGLLASDAVNDGDLQFGSNVPWDFDRTNGINVNQFDFEGVVIHEIGHALGFISGVDTFEFNAPNGAGNFFNDNQLTLVSTLDLFRFSTRSGVTRMDFALDNNLDFFSINGGATSLAPFSTGVRYGDGNQASHWQDRNFPGQTALGVMDPVITNGELSNITLLDRRAMDVIGWDLVPEPTSFAVLGLGLLALRRRKKQQ